MKTESQNPQKGEDVPGKEKTKGGQNKKPLYETLLVVFSQQINYPSA